MSNDFSVKVEAAPTFQRNIRKLSRKYRLIRKDVQPVIEQLQQGVFLGDRIPNVNYEVFKLRIRNSDVQKGKSGGYRLIYYLRAVDQVILLTIYSKSDQSDISATAIKQIIEETDAG